MPLVTVIGIFFLFVPIFWSDRRAHPSSPLISFHFQSSWFCSLFIILSVFTMVFFLCDGCNETLKKNKVDAHAAKCRECWSVSCVDCSQSFPGGKNIKYACTVNVSQHMMDQTFLLDWISHNPWVQSNVLIKL